MSVANGELANQTTFNTSFMSREVNTNTVGVVALENTDGLSGTSITNVQKELNAISSYAGKAVNTAANSTPTYTYNYVGTQNESLKSRADSLTNAFAASGHSHDGSASGGGLIDILDTAGTLTIARGGTGSTSLDPNALLYSDGDSLVESNIFKNGTDYGVGCDPSATFDIAGDISLREETSSATGNVTGLSHNNSIIRITSPINLYGIDSTGVENTVLLLMNASTGSISVFDQSASASSSNKIITGLGQDTTIPAGGVALTAYDTTSDKWRLLSTSSIDASTSNSGIVNTTTQSFAGNKTFSGSIKTQTSFILEDPASGTNTITVQAPTGLSPSYTLTMPSDDGVSGQVLTTDGSGNLSWSTVTVGVSGVLSLSEGGTSKNMTAVAGGVVYTDSDSMEVTSAGASGQVLLSSGSSAPSWGTDVLGVSTNSNASSGYKGEYVESVVTSLTNFPTTGQFGDFTSISLTAGDWDVSAMMNIAANGSTVTAINVGISTTSGNSSSGLQFGNNAFEGKLPVVSGSDGNGYVPVYRMSLSTTTTVYFKYAAAYSVATPQARGRLSARRIR